MRPKSIPAILAGLALSAATGVHAAGCKNSPTGISATAPFTATFTVNSGPAATAIAELYTAEGCDSCPPADKWFSTLRDRQGGLVTLAYHVDYWDAGGWADRFAKPAFARRQRETVLRQGSRTLFTPQIMVNGREILFNTPDPRRGSIHSRFNANVNEIASRPPRASLTLRAAVLPDHIETALSVAIPAVADRGDAAAFLAITENNLVSRITAGENGGITLYHDHVVRELIGPVPLAGIGGTDGQFVVNGNVALGRDWKRGDLSVVSFVQNQRSGEVYQALSSPICGKD